MLLPFNDISGSPPLELPDPAARPSASSLVSGGGGIKTCPFACAVLTWRCLEAAEAKDRQQNEHLCTFLEIEPPGGLVHMATPWEPLR